jgi:hypothetical protein
MPYADPKSQRTCARKCQRVYYAKHKGVILAKKHKSDSYHREELSVKQKAYREKNKEKILAREKIYRLKNKDRITKWRKEHRGSRREWELKYHYGLTGKDYENMATLQRGVCAICGKPPSGRKIEKNLHVDHDHKSGLVRALLCNRCNRVLGLIGDDALIASKIISYLNQHPQLWEEHSPIKNLQEVCQ